MVKVRESPSIIREHCVRLKLGENRHPEQMYRWAWQTSNFISNSRARCDNTEEWVGGGRRVEGVGLWCTTLDIA